MRQLWRGVVLILLALVVGQSLPAAAQAPGQATANPRLQSRLVVFEAFMRST